MADISSKRGRTHEGLSTGKKIMEACLSVATGKDYPEMIPME